MLVSSLVAHPKNLEAWTRYHQKRNKVPDTIRIQHHIIESGRDILIREVSLNEKQKMITMGRLPKRKGQAFLLTDARGAPVAAVEENHLELSFDGEDIHARLLARSTYCYLFSNGVQAPLHHEQKSVVQYGDRILLGGGHYLTIVPAPEPKNIPPYLPVVGEMIPDGHIAVLDTRSLLIWCLVPGVTQGFRLPLPSELLAYSRREKTAFQDEKGRILGREQLCVAGGRELYLQSFTFKNWLLRTRRHRIEGDVFLCHDGLLREDVASIHQADDIHLLHDKLREQGFSLFLHEHPHIPVDADVIKSLHEALFPVNRERNKTMNAQLQYFLTHGDYFRNKLPALGTTALTDPNQGVWELALQAIPKGYQQYPMGADVYAKEPVVHDETHISIDFGTSNTVAARRNHSNDELISISIFHPSQENTKDVENPTVLSFRDTSFHDVWQEVQQRPMIFWSSLASAHDAQEEQRNGQSIMEVDRLSSILPMLKSWALKKCEDPHEVVHRFDAQRNRFSLFLGEKEQGELVSFDPIELYAWHLGLAINNMYGGVHTQYTLSFPIVFPQEVCTRLTESFRKGLFRSVPASVAYTDSFQEKFMVHAGHSEPIAFSAYALDESGIQPTQQGVAFAIFDIGGGTSDFAFGLWRTPQEHDELEFDIVLEHNSTSGILYLGGEMLLHELAYRAFEENMQQVLRHEVPFRLPPQNKRHHRLRHLLNEGYEAQINTQILMNALRGFMEGTEEISSGESMSLSFLNIHQQEVDVQLMIPVDELGQHLRLRFQKGIEQFVHGLAAAFAGGGHEEIHVFLAGNGSKSRFFLSLMEESRINETMQAHFHHAPHLRIHQDVTCKTGTALGQLRLLPGSNIKAKIRESRSFEYYIGFLQDNTITNPIYKNQPLDSMLDTWQPIAQIRDGLATILWTTNDKAWTEEGFEDLYEEGTVWTKVIACGENLHNAQILAQIQDTQTLRLAVLSLEDLDVGVRDGDIVGTITFRMDEAIFQEGN